MLGITRPLFLFKDIFLLFSLLLLFSAIVAFSILAIFSSGLHHGAYVANPFLIYRVLSGMELMRREREESKNNGRKFR